MRVDLRDALKTKTVLPGYLLKIMQSYLQDREVVYDMSQGRRRKHVMSGAAQGSIIGPDLWSITCDDVFPIEMSNGAHFVGYEEDVAAIIVARNVEERSTS